jgi:hypothetical protein
VTRKLASAAHVVLLALALAAAAYAKPERGGAMHSLSDTKVGTTRAELTAQVNYSEHVITFFTQGHRWMPALRHADCWSHVPWAHICDVARRHLIRHRMLLAKAKRRLARFAQSVFPPHHALWTCIGAHEGSPTSVNPNGHYGLLQMTWNWMGLIKGAASNYPRAVQEWAAERAWAENGYSVSFLDGQWLEWDGAYECLVYA